jgi:D-alanine-D-alanine ligase
MGQKVAFTYNLKRKVEEGLPDDYYSEFDSKETIEAIANGLRSRGNEVFLVEADKGLLNWFQSNKVDIVFNIAEGINGESREAQVPAILDFLGIPYTGSGVLALSVSLDKAFTKKIFEQAGIPTPSYKLIKEPAEISDEGLRYPLIVKPNREGSGKGITITSVVRNRVELDKEVCKTYSTYRQEVLVEEFIEGRELTVGLIGNSPPMALPILEIDFSNCKASGEFFYTWKVKEFEKEVEDSRGLSPIWHCPARLTKQEEALVGDTAVRAFNTLGCVDLSRVDIILDKEGVPYVLEINPLPGLDPVDSNFPFIAKCAGLDYPALMNRILDVAIERHTKNGSLVLHERSLR